MKSPVIILLALFLLGCEKAPIQIRSSEIKDSAILPAERTLSDAVRDCWELKRERNELILLLIERERLNPLTWCTENTVDSLIEVVKELPPRKNIIIVEPTKYRMTNQHDF